ncbi:hypothetical protein EV1_039688 [Malus domestica]
MMFHIAGHFYGYIQRTRTWQVNEVQSWNYTNDRCNAIRANVTPGRPEKEYGVVEQKSPELTSTIHFQG